jgi:CheY-like chemotaxis protein
MSRKLILVVDDDDDIRDNLRTFLEEEGYQVHLAANGRDALDYLDGCTSLPALILLDLMMPVLDGWGFRARQREAWYRDVPVAVFTATGRQAPPIDADAIVHKPVHLDDLIAIIHKLCGAA